MIKVFIVEDTPAVRETLQNAINRQTDMECIESFSSGEKALSRLRLKQPNVIIMDIDLSEGEGKMDGIECMLEIKKRDPNVLVLMYTVFDSDDRLFEALRKGADGYILKRDSIIKVVKAIRESIEGGAPMSRPIARKILMDYRQENQSADGLKELTERQLQVLELVAKGYPNSKIAQKLDIAEGTVKLHLNKIYKVLQVNNRTEAANKYLESNQ